MDRKTITRISFAAMFAALTALFITLIHIPYGETGYIHLGDAVILLCAAVLPAPYAIPAAAVGGGLADLFSGFPLYIIPTVIIKSLMALTLSSKTGTVLCRRNLAGAGVAVGLNLLLYAVAEWVLGLAVYGLTPGGALAVAVTTLPQNAIQGAASFALFVPLAAGFDKLRAKTTFHP
ncbi:MAG: ECF transporter S component [Clostridia bacterium]|nr:ECF transporter S component [Clostridia bacterium]MBR3551921.1 ECF transporter S component [Clostridia bacterium]